jgi:hypothetical protein
VACATGLTATGGKGSILTTQTGDVDSNTLGLAGKGKAIQPSRPDRRLRLVIPAVGQSPAPTSCVKGPKTPMHGRLYENRQGCGPAMPGEA